MTYLSIPDELDKRLATFAAKAHLSKDEYACRLLEEILEDHEDYLKALEISQKIEKGKEKTIPYEKVMNKNEKPSH